MDNTCWRSCCSKNILRNICGQTSMKNKFIEQRTTYTKNTDLPMIDIGQSIGDYASRSSRSDHYEVVHFFSMRPIVVDAQLFLDP